MIEKELGQRANADLVAMILVIAKEHAVVARELEDRLNIEKPVDLLVAVASSAIDRATDFDERMMNHNFDVDWQAYACSIQTTATAKSSCACRTARPSPKVFGRGKDKQRSLAELLQKTAPLRSDEDAKQARKAQMNAKREAAKAEGRELRHASSVSELSNFIWVAAG